jgi:hypothetical protein
MEHFKTALTHFGSLAKKTAGAAVEVVVTGVRAAKEYTASCLNIVSRQYSSQSRAVIIGLVGGAVVTDFFYWFCYYSSGHTLAETLFALTYAQLVAWSFVALIVLVAGTILRECQHSTATSTQALSAPSVN